MVAEAELGEEFWEEVVGGLVVSVSSVSSWVSPWGRGGRQRTKRMAWAFRRAISSFFLAWVMSFSARRWASLALGQVVWMASSLISEVTRLRRRALRWDESRESCRYFMCPPAMVGCWLEGLEGREKDWGGLVGGRVVVVEQGVGWRVVVDLLKLGSSRREVFGACHGPRDGSACRPVSH